MTLRPRDARVHSTVEAEAAAYRREAAETRRLMAALRAEIRSCVSELHAFATDMMNRDELL